MKKFSRRFILNFTLIVLAAFGATMVLFNQVATHFIQQVADQDLRIAFRSYVPLDPLVLVYPAHNGYEPWQVEGGGWDTVSLDGIWNFFGVPYGTPTWTSFPLSVVLQQTRDFIIFNHRGSILTNSPFDTQMRWDDAWESLEKPYALARYYQADPRLFADGQMQRILIHDQTYYMRQVTVDDYMKMVFEQIDDGEEVEFLRFPQEHQPYTVLLYTDVTEMVNFQQRINQLLMIVLSISSLLLLTVAYFMSRHFNRSLKLASTYAKEIGQGNWTSEAPTFSYEEFANLGGDLTDMKHRLERANQKEKEFSQNVSHELRTPLAVIQMYAAGLLETVFEPSEAGKIILDETERMSALITNLLQLARLDHGHQKLETATVSANQLVENCLGLVKGTGKSITVDYLPGDQQLQGDWALMETALLNLLTNAIRHCHQHVSIALSATNSELIIAIANDGPTINQSDLPHLFERFYKTQDGNTGVGLALVHEIMKRYGGRANAVNLAAGVRFELIFPL